MPVGRQKDKLNANFDQDISWYLKRFSHAKANQLCGEISPVYLGDHDAPAAIQARYPDVKLLVSLRNPVDRAFSFYKLHRGNSIIDPMSFEKALQEEYVYVKTGLYGEHLARYLEYFDKDQILLVIFERLIAEPDRELNRIYKFLGVEIPTDFDLSKYHTNKTMNMRSTKLHKFAIRFSQWLIGHGFSSVLTWLRNAGAHKLLNKVNTAPVQRESIQESTRLQLQAEFKEDIVKVENMFDVDLGGWK